MNKEFEKLLDLAYSDGILTDDEKVLLLKKAEDLEIDKTEAELYILNYKAAKPIPPVRTEIESVAELESYLENLRTQATPSWQSALDAQLQVLSYVNSPELIGTTLDSLFASIKKAKTAAKDDIEKELIMERGAIFIQNFVFFLHAKLIYAVDQNRKQGEELQKKAAKILMKSVTSAVGGAAGGPQAAAIQFSNAFIEEITSDDVINRFILYFNKKAENARKKNQFFESLTLLYDKLERHYATVGKCDVIAGLIRNYAEKLANHQTKEAEDSLAEQLNQVEKLKSKTLSRPIILITLSVITYILRWIWHGFIKAEQFVEHLIIDESEVVSNSSNVSWTGWHFIITSGILVGVYLYHFSNYRKALKDYKKNEENIDEYSSNLLSAYERIATKYDEV